MPTPSKDRKYQRVPLPKGPYVVWQAAGARQVSKVSVMALGGLFISTSDPLRVGDVLKLVFEVPGGEVCAQALVRDSQAGKGMGVQFTAMTPDARARLNRLMKTLTMY